MTTSPCLPTDLGHELVYGFAARLIRWKAKQIAARYSLTTWDCEDIAQELRLQLVLRRERFDPAIAPWNTFVRVVVQRRCATLVGRRFRLLLRHEAALHDCDAWIVAAALEPATFPTERIEIAIDTRDVIVRLPRPARALCRRLMYASVADVARQLGLARSTLRGRIARLAEQFAAAGF